MLPIHFRQCKKSKVFYRGRNGSFDAYLDFIMRSFLIHFWKGGGPPLLNCENEMKPTLVLDVDHKRFLIHWLSAANHLVYGVACVIGHLCHINSQNWSWVVCKWLVFMTLLDLKNPYSISRELRRIEQKSIPPLRSKNPRAAINRS